MTTEVLKPTGPTSPLQLYQMALEKGLDPDKLGKLLDLHERIMAQRAKEAFDKDMNLCQGEVPAILDDATNKQTGSSYARLETVQIAVKPIYIKHGFSLSWSEGEIKDGLHEILMTVRHVAGHTEIHRGWYPIDGEGPKGGRVMNQLQGSVSAHTYAQRDMMRQLFNIVLKGMDYDGNHIQGGLSDGQTEELNNLLEACSINGWTESSKQQFWDWLFVKSNTKKRMPEMSAAHYGRAKEWLSGWLKKYGKKGGA
jgi:ERF superfamily